MFHCVEKRLFLQLAVPLLVQRESPLHQVCFPFIGKSVNPGYRAEISRKQRYMVISRGAVWSTFSVAMSINHARKIQGESAWETLIYYSTLTKLLYDAKYVWASLSSIPNVTYVEENLCTVQFFLL